LAFEVWSKLMAEPIQVELSRPLAHVLGSEMMRRFVDGPDNRSDAEKLRSERLRY